MDNLSRFCCLNSACSEHGKRGAGNLTVTSWYGLEKERRRLRCGVYKDRFSERKGTPLFDPRLPPEKIESVLEHIAECVASARPAGSARCIEAPSAA